MRCLAKYLNAFLREHLPRDRKASTHTCETYAHSYQLLACFAAQRLKVLARHNSEPAKVGRTTTAARTTSPPLTY
jgi:hypothetical protein